VRWCGLFNDDFTTSLLLSLRVNEFWKLQYLMKLQVKPWCFSFLRDTV